MPYLLDTDVVIDYLQSEPLIRALLRQLRSDGFFISAVTHMEVVDGVLTSVDSATTRAELNELLRSVLIMSFTQREAERCAQLRTALRARNRAIRARYLDLMIAATALSHGLTLVTRNVADYRDVPGLDVVAPEQLEAPRP